MGHGEGVDTAHDLEAQTPPERAGGLRDEGAEAVQGALRAPTAGRGDRLDAENDCGMPGKAASRR